MQIAYENNLLTQENDLVRLADLFSLYNLPYNSASLITNIIENNKLKPSPPLVQTLYYAYSSAKEGEQATLELTKYSDAKTHPLLFIQAAYQNIENEEWDKAEQLLVKIDNKNSTYPEVYLGMAIVKIYQNKYDDARGWLESAMKHKSTRNAAIEWMNFLKAKSGKI